MELCYTGVGTILAGILWVFSGIWEWSVPETVERKTNHLRNKTNCKNALFQLKEENRLFEHEQFAYYIKNRLPRLERELGQPIHVEVKIDKSDKKFSDEEKRYIGCLSRLFPEYSWSTKEGLEPGVN